VSSTVMDDDEAILAAALKHLKVRLVVMPEPMDTVEKMVESPVWKRTMRRVALGHAMNAIVSNAEINPLNIDATHAKTIATIAALLVDAADAQTASEWIANYAARNK